MCRRQAKCSTVFSALGLAGLLFFSPENERLLLGPSPFFRHEAMERAARAGDDELLKKAADSPKWDARRLAAVGLGSRTPLKLLADPVPVVRAAAVRGLDMAAPEPELVKLLRDPDDAVRAAAAWALRGARSKSPLRALAKDPSPAVRAAALAAGGQFAKLRSELTRGELGDAVAAAGALGRAGGASDAAFLLRQLATAVKAAGSKRAKLPYVRAEPHLDLVVARAVGDCARRGLQPGGKPVVEHLRRLVANAKLEGAGAPGVLLAEAIAGARDVKSARYVLDAQIKARRESTLPNAIHDPAIAGILHAFAREPWPELAPALAPLMQDRDPSIRREVVRAAGAALALRGLKDRHPLVRAAACERCDDLGALARATRDGDARVQAAAARALGRLGDPAALDALTTLLAEGAPDARRAAVGAWLRVPDPKRRERLVAVAMMDDAPRVRAAAGAVLAFVDGEAAAPEAIAELVAPEEERRKRAIALLHALTSARFGYDAAKPGAGARAWHAWWEQRKKRAAAPDAFTYHVEDLRRHGVDLVLVFDATGSMARIIQATKRRIEGVVAGLRRVVPNLRARIVAYRDEGEPFVTLGSSLTHDGRLLEDFLAAIPADGGGDAEEAVLAGLRNAFRKTPWRDKSRRIVLLFGDAPPHGREMPLLETVVAEFPGTVHAVDVGAYGLGGQASLNERSFRAIAGWGRGTFVRAGNEAELLREILVLTLGAEHRARIEALFGL